MKHRARFKFATAYVAGSLTMISPAHAAERFWDNGTGGAFSLATNWLDGQTLGVPTTSDAAIFDLPSLYTVSFNSPQLTDRLLVKRGNVTFTFSFLATQYTLLNQLSSTPSIAIGPAAGDSASLTILGGTLGGSFTDVGQAAGSFGLLRVKGGNAKLNNGYQLRVGNQGVGQMHITNSADVTNGSASIGSGSGSSGEMTVDGSGSYWNCLGDLSIGKGGFGDMTISNGALVECQDAVIAQLLSSFGSVSISGPNSTWAVHGTLDIGMLGYGSMTVSNGGAVTNEVFATVGTFPNNYPNPGGGVGDVHIDGTGSSWSILGDLYVGYMHEGHLTISNSGSVIATGNLTLGNLNTHDGVGYLTLASAGHVIVNRDLRQSLYTPLIVQLAHHNDYLVPAMIVGGTATGFTCRVELLKGFIPASGDSFTIVSAANIAPAFSLDLPALPNNVQWQVIQNSTTLQLKVICALPADVTHNGRVDADDLLTVISAWGACHQPCPPSCAADLNGDCSVNVTDLLAVIGGWGSCP